MCALYCFYHFYPRKKAWIIFNPPIRKLRVKPVIGLYDIGNARSWQFMAPEIAISWQFMAAETAGYRRFMALSYILFIWYDSSVLSQAFSSSFLHIMVIR
jgi:hypothetical protein